MVRLFRLARAAVLLAVCLVPSPAHAVGPHTFDGKHDISTIDLTVVYLVPKDRTALADWRDRVDYYTKRIARFHDRESGGTSTLKVTVHPEPLVVAQTAEALRGKDPNQTFFNSTRAARRALEWPGERGEGFPIILVLSEINWRELDDFTRLRDVDGKLTHEGSLSQNGRHFPGAESGGARAYYDANRRMGVGLVSADGWRVPYSGSDCVIYHEGVGHAIGLPHPTPPDDSVMCFAQYNFWINQTWVPPSQKAALGWPGGDETAPPDRSKTKDLFTAFTALQGPIVPRVKEPVRLTFTWPEGAKVRSITIRVQTELRGPWRTIANDAAGSPPESLPIGSFDEPTPVSYRANAILEDRQEAEIWGYFQVKAGK